MSHGMDWFASDDPNQRNDNACKIPASLPLGADLPPTIDRFREMAAASWDALVTEGPVHADHVLLDLCAEALHHRRLAAGHRAVQLSKRAAKLRATTPAGIYAKALVVRSSQTAAAMLAMSLAEDLVSSDVLRKSLWPATAAEAVP